MVEDEGSARPRRPVTHEIGADLAPVSVEELGERVALMRAEIERLEEEARRKERSRRAADAVFRT